jgi:SAM-dependent methyltransferase
MTTPIAPYWNDLSHHIGSSIEDAFWLGHPLIRARVNRRISGNESVWPTDWLRDHLGSRLPLEHCLSIGCGTGPLERDLVQKGIAARIVGIDIEDEPLVHARQEREKAGISPDQLAYVRADARQFLSSQASLDGVFFHGSLHHFDRLDDLLQRVSAALRPGGLLYVDEYVGPSMREWNWRTLFLANLFHNLVSWKVRRVGLIRAPRNPHDPTEMICASEIAPAIRRHFQIEAVRDYGGNLLSLIYPNLQRPAPDRARPTREGFDRAVTFLLDVEDYLLRYGPLVGLRSHHSIILARADHPQRGA